MLDDRRIHQLALVAALAALATMVGGVLQVAGEVWPGGDLLATGLIFEPTVLALLVLPTAVIVHPRLHAAPVLVVPTIVGAALQALAYSYVAWTYVQGSVSPYVGRSTAWLAAVVALSFAAVAALMGVLAVRRWPSPDPQEAV